MKLRKKAQGSLLKIGYEKPLETIMFDYGLRDMQERIRRQ